MLELSSGELFVVAFVTIAVVSALWWPRLGAMIAELLVHGRPERKSSTPPGSGSSDRGERAASSESSRG